MNEGWLDELDWDCVVGDLFDLEVEAIAIPVNTVLNLNYRLGRQLVARCSGPALGEQLLLARRSLISGRLKVGQAVSIEVSELPHARRVILAAWWNENNVFDKRLLYGVATRSIREANAQSCRSLALPMFGARGGVDDDVRARVFCRALQDLHGVRDSIDFPVRRLLFYDKAAERVEIIDQHFTRELYSHLET
jgi:O-acetyl-ADP-ribose deacetylase (regulator of RNase III)